MKSDSKTKNQNRRLFDESDEQDEEEEQNEINQVQSQPKIQTTDLYQQNLKKYIDLLKQFAYTSEDRQEVLFNDGISCLNHPLIEVTQNYQKNTGIFDLVDVQKTSNSFTKTLVIFTFLDNEVNKIIELLQLNLYDSLIMYGQQATKDPADLQQPQMMTSRVLNIYKQIYDLVRKLMSYIENIIMQIHSIINKKQPAFKTIFRDSNFDFVFDILSRALRAIYVIDCIVQNNNNISQHWQAYKKVIKLARNQPDKFGTTLSKVKKLQKYIDKLERTVLSKGCMEVVMSIKFDEKFEIEKSQLGVIRTNKELKQYMETYMERQLKSVNDNLGLKYQNEEEKKFLDLMCFYALYRRLYPAEEGRDMWKNLWAMQKKIPILQAHSFVCVYVFDFMQIVCPLAKKSKNVDPKDDGSFLKQYVQRLAQNVTLDFVSSYTKFCVWLSRMESIITSNYSLKDLKRDEKGVKILRQKISNRILILNEGVALIMKMNRLLYLCFMLCMNQSQPITKQFLGNMILCMETMKAIALIIRRKADAFDTMILTKFIAKDIYALIRPLYNKIYMQQKVNKKKQNNQKLSALSLLLILLDGPISELKIAMIKYILGLIGDEGINKQQLAHIKSLIKKLQVVAYFSVYVQKYQNCSYLYYCKEILSKIFQWKQENPTTCKRLQFLFQTFEDSAYLIKKCPHLVNPDEIFLQYKQFVLKQFEQNYMRPLKRKIQDFLRVSIHFMLIEKLQGSNPFNTQMSDLTKLVQLQKIRIFDTMIDLKIQIGRSLNETFYNMNIMNMHDMETYEQMRVLGNHLFGLKLHDVFLPSQTIDQGNFNILSIIRSIPKFIQEYKYNLLSQSFLEITGEGKIINCIGIQQLSDSIKTHGLGILATTVNVFYKFLITKVQGFNKFLFDDYIQSPLVKDKKWFKQYSAKDDYQGYYPYERAEYIYKQIKKIGRFEDQSNFLDKFRETITAVGNSLGFVRLIRSASLNSSSKLVEFLPKKLDIPESYAQIASNTSLSQLTKKECQQLDNILKSFDDKFSSKIDYLNLMIKAFSKIVTKQNKHLKLFYLIIPALTINFVEHMSKGKEQINKKLSSKAFIYDDGFVLGLTYFINLLKQNQEVKTLHWDDATKVHFQTEKNYSKDVKNASNHSAKYIEDLNMQKQLLIKKLQMMEYQFQLLHNNMVSANVLFQGNDTPIVQPQKSQPQPTSPPTQEQAQNQQQQQEEENQNQ